VQTFFRRSIGHLLDKANIEIKQLVGIGVAFPDDIQRADLPDQPSDYSIWGSVSIERLLARTLPIPISSRTMPRRPHGRDAVRPRPAIPELFYVLITAALVAACHRRALFRGASGPQRRARLATRGPR